MKTLTQRLDHWLNAHVPDVADDLAPGCSEHALAALEQQLGTVLPDDFKALYRWHDGQRDEVNSGPFYGLSFLSLDKVKAHWQSWNSVIEENTADDLQDLSEFCTSQPPDAIKCTYANKGWIPFAYDYGGNHLGIDLDPGKQGRVGQVINFGRDEDNKFVVAPSVHAFIQWLVEQLESGNALIREEDDGGHSLNTKTPESSHFLDAVAVIFAPPQ